MKSIVRVVIAVVFTVVAANFAGAQTNVLRIATLKTGTVNWELDTIKHYGLDEANGFDLQITGMAGNPATTIAFQGGEVDVIVSDWIWVARQRAAGKDYVFFPYSKAVGSLMVKQDDPVQSLTDMKGRKIGIAGGPVDKSWLILRAYAQKEYGMDLAAETEQVFGAPPLIFKSALGGEVAGAINFWHFAAKMKAKGMRELISIADAAEHIGLDADLPLLGYVVKGEFLRENPQLVAGLATASRAAKEKLAGDESAWERIRPIMNANTDEDFAALKAGFIQGMPEPGPIDIAAAGKALEVMAEYGGEKLVGGATSLPEGVFVQPQN